MDLWTVQQSALDRTRHRPGIFRSAVRSPGGVSDLEDASVREKDFGGRKAGALRREVIALRRLVCDAADLRGWRADYRGFRELFGFAEVEGHSPGDEERDAGGRDDF